MKSTGKVMVIKRDNQIFWSMISVHLWENFRLLLYPGLMVAYTEGETY
jgi:hypothetical protein